MPKTRKKTPAKARAQAASRKPASSRAPAPKRSAAVPRKPARPAQKAAKSKPARAAAFDEAFVRRLARKSIQALKPYVPGKSIEEVRAQYDPPVITKLGSNENPLGA